MDIHQLLNLLKPTGSIMSSRDKSRSSFGFGSTVKRLKNLTVRPSFEYTIDPELEHAQFVLLAHPHHLLDAFPTTRDISLRTQTLSYVKNCHQHPVGMSERLPSSLGTPLSMATAEGWADAIGLSDARHGLQIAGSQERIDSKLRALAVICRHAHGLDTDCSWASTLDQHAEEPVQESPITRETRASASPTSRGHQIKKRVQPEERAVLKTKSALVSASSTPGSSSKTLRWADDEEGGLAQTKFVPRSGLGKPVKRAQSKRRGSSGKMEVETGSSSSMKRPQQASVEEVWDGDNHKNVQDGWTAPPSGPAYELKEVTWDTNKGKGKGRDPKLYKIEDPTSDELDITMTPELEGDHRFLQLQSVYEVLEDSKDKDSIRHKMAQYKYEVESGTGESELVHWDADIEALCKAFSDRGAIA